MPDLNFQQVKEFVARAIEEKKLTKEFLKSLGPSVVEVLTPILDKIAENTAISKTEILSALSSLKINVPKSEVPKAEIEVKIPEIKVPEPRVEVRVPEIKVPTPEVTINPTFKVPKPEVTVNFDSSKIKVPDIKMPDEMDIRGWVSLMGYDRGFLKDPFPVQIRDASGNPVNFGNSAQTIISGGSGKADYFTIKGFSQSAFSEITNPDGRVKVELPTGSSGLTDNELRATAVPVSQVSGATWSVSVNDIFRTTVSSNLINSDDRIRVSVETGGSGLTDNELRASGVEVHQVSGANWSVSITGATGSIAAALVDSSGVQYSGSNPLPVSAAVTFDQAQDEGEADGRTLRVVHAGDVGVSVRGIGGTFDTVTTVTSITNSVGAALVDSSGVQYSGSNPVPVGGMITGVTNSIAATVLNGDGTTRDSWLVSDITNSIKSALIDSSGVQYSGSNPVPAIITHGGNTASVDTAGGDDESNTSNRLNVRSHISWYDGTTWDRARGDSTNGLLVNLGGNNDVTVTGSLTAVTSITNSVAAAIVDSTGVQYSGANQFPVTINGATNSILATGTTLHDAADDGDAPLKVGGVAVTANPTAVSGGDRVKFTADDLGRQLVRPVQVRDLIATAYVSLSTGTETTLLASGSGVLADLIYVMAANQSDAATYLEIRASTGGTVLMMVEVPAKGTAGIATPVPVPQGFADATWTVDMPDITGTTVGVTALFSKEV